MRKKIHTVNHSQWKGENSNENTTRLLCGSAYRRGILGALELLGNLRSHPYKAKSPESRLNLNSIVLHSIQSVTISVMFATVAITLGLMQLFFYVLAPDNILVLLFLNLIG